MFKNIKKKSAFTLIELIVVMAVIGVLVLLATPKFMGYTKKAQITEIKSNIKQLETASERFYLDKGDWPRLSDVPYTADELMEITTEIRNLTGEDIQLDPDGKYYAIDYDALQKYVQKPKNDFKYLLQNPIGDVYYVNSELLKPEKDASPIENEHEDKEDDDIDDEPYVEEEIILEKPEIVLSLSQDETKMIATIYYKHNENQKNQYKIDNGAWLDYSGPVTMNLTFKISARVLVIKNETTMTEESEIKLLVPSIKSEKVIASNRHLVTVNFLETDKVKEYKIDNGTWTSYTGSFYVDDIVTIQVRGYNDKNQLNSYNTYKTTNLVESYTTFDGINDYAQLSANAPLISKSTNGTIEFLFNYDAESPTTRKVIYAECPTWGESFVIYIQNNNLNLISWKTEKTNFSPGIIIRSLQTNKWYHMAVSWDANTTWVYLNGELVHQVNETFKTNDSVSQAYIGGGREYDGSTNGFFGNYFKGKLSEFRIWNVTRTQSDIQTNMTNLLTGNESGLLRLFKMNNTSNTIIDATGRANITINR